MYTDTIGKVTTVKKIGSLYVWSCHLHSDDGKNKGVQSWSCKGYPDGRWYCFGCQASGSVIDLAVYAKLGYHAQRGQKLVEYDVDGDRIVPDEPLRAAYAEILGDPAYRNFVRQKDPSEREGRPFTEAERVFLGKVYELMHQDLMRDQEGLAYLLSRLGTAATAPGFGVARPWQMKHILDIARGLGREELAETTGIATKKPEFKGRMHYLLQHSVVAFGLSVYGQGAYYQARSLLKTRGGEPIEKPYYDPAGIAREPIVLGSHGPVVAGEGVYDVAWVVPYGFRAMPLLGPAPEHYDMRQLAPLKDGIFLADRLPEAVSTRVAQVIKNKIELSGWKVTIRRPPAPHKDPNDWARSIGFDAAAEYLRSLLQKPTGRYTCNPI